MCCVTLNRAIIVGLLVATTVHIPTWASSPAPASGPLISTTTDISETTPVPPTPITATVPTPAQVATPIPSTPSPTPAQPPSHESKPSSTVSGTADTTEEKQQEPVTIDTMNLVHETKGNWLYKRFWWEQARKLYDKILNRLKAILAVRDSFSHKYTTILNTVFADFYKKSGYGQGELDTILTMLKADLEEKRTKLATLGDQERTAFATLEKEKEQLDTLHTAIQAIGALSTSFDDAINLLQQQVMLCNGYEQQAAQQLGEIERELNDKQAKESYHHMRTAFENIVNIEGYIQSDFTRYFSTLETKTQEHITLVMESLAALKERGIDLMKQVEKIRPECDVKLSTTVQQENAPSDSQQYGIVRWFSSAWNTVSDAVSRAISWIRSFWTSETHTPAMPETTDHASGAPVTP